MTSKGLHVQLLLRTPWRDRTDRASLLCCPAQQEIGFVDIVLKHLPGTNSYVRKSSNKWQPHAHYRDRSKDSVTFVYVLQDIATTRNPLRTLASVLPHFTIGIRLSDRVHDERLFEVTHTSIWPRLFGLQGSTEELLDRTNLQFTELLRSRDEKFVITVPKGSFGTAIAVLLKSTQTERRLLVSIGTAPSGALGFRARFTERTSIGIQKGQEPPPVDSRFDCSNGLGSTVHLHDSPGSEYFELRVIEKPPSNPRDSWDARPSGVLEIDIRDRTLKRIEARAQIFARPPGLHLQARNDAGFAKKYICNIRAQSRP